MLRGDLKTSDDDLIRRAQELAPGALAELYDRYFDGIYRYAYTRIGHHADAEDLTEQVFLKMVDSIHTYRPRQGAGLSSWLYRIAHNLVVDRYRRAGREAGALAEHLEDRTPRANPGPTVQSCEARRRLVD